MRNMVLPRSIRCVKLFPWQITRRNQLRHPHKFLLGVSLVLVLYFPDRLSAGRNVGVEPKIADAILEWENLCLAVHGQIQALQIYRYRFQAVFQISLAWVNQIEIVHVPAVILNAKLVLDELVHSIQIEQCKALVDLIAQWTYT